MDENQKHANLHGRFTYLSLRKISGTWQLAFYRHSMFILPLTKVAFEEVAHVQY